MKRIIEYADQRIDACAKCQARFGCDWFKAAGEVALDMPSEEYIKLTHEEIANKIHSSMIEPSEGCDQVSFDEMMQEVDKLLQLANPPFS